MKLLPSILALVAGVALLALATSGEENSLFAPSNLTTTSGQRADPDIYYEAKDCAECHTEQYKDWKGSMHSRAHHDPIYLA
ncbi:MAG: multiheme c-type cytochrome, partial [Planctomycetota bacterium]